MKSSEGVRPLMRLTLINQFYTPDISPTAHMCASLAEHRAQLGDEVTVITGRGGYVAPLSGESQDGRVRVLRLWTSQLGSRTTLRRLADWGSFYLMAFWRALRLPRQDMIIAMTTPPFIAWAGLAHKLIRPGTKLVLWNMDSYPEAVERTNLIRQGGFVSRVLRKMNRILFRRLDHLVCLDGAMTDLLVRDYGPKGHRMNVSIIPNWERASLFPNHLPIGSAAQVRPLNSWDDPIVDTLRDRFVILYLGNTGFGHELSTILDAAERLRNDPVTFLFVGGGAKWPWLQEQQRERKLDNVVLHGYVPKEQTPAVMRFASCALIALDDFALGVMSPSKLHSNLAMGLPVIYVGPEGSNVDEAIRRFGCGISVRHGEVERLVGAVRRWIADRAEHEDLRRRARQAFDEAYCDLETLPQFDAIIDGQRECSQPSGNSGSR